MSLIFSQLPDWAKPHFPMFQYRCPICHTLLGYNPKEMCMVCDCISKYESKREPPNYLKEPRGVHNYVHNELLHKKHDLFTFEQRLWLALNFSPDLFNDGFEAGDFSAWDGTVTTNNGDSVLEVLNTDPHHGYYQAHALCDRTGETDASNYCYWDDGATLSVTTLYTRMYCKFLQFCDDSSNGVILYRASGTSLAYVGVNTGGTPYELRLRIRNGAGWNAVVGATAILLNIYYCIELKVVVADGVGGEGRVYLGDVEEITKTNIDSDDYGNITRVCCGLSACFGTADHEIHYDCCVVDSARIHCEVAGIPTQMYHYNRFKKIIGG